MGCPWVPNSDTGSKHCGGLLPSASACVSCVCLRGKTETWEKGFFGVGFHQASYLPKAMVCSSCFFSGRIGKPVIGHWGEGRKETVCHGKEQWKVVMNMEHFISLSSVQRRLLGKLWELPSGQDTLHGRSSCSHLPILGVYFLWR